MTTTASPYGYQLGPEPIAVIGKMKPFGRRILCRAILETDDYERRHAGDRNRLTLATYSSVEAVAFEVVALGGHVAKACAEIGEEPLRVGEHVELKSVAADRVHTKDSTGRYWSVDVSDVATRWDPVALDEPGLMAACEAIGARQSMAAAVASTMQGNGEAILAPR